MSKKLPSAVRNCVWNTYVGIEQKLGICFCCNIEPISFANFECGHIQSRVNGGDDTIQNLRPICSLCNKSMGKTNMIEFIEKYGFNKKKSSVCFKTKRINNKQKKEPLNTKNKDIELNNKKNNNIIKYSIKINIGHILSLKFPFDLWNGKTALIYGTPYTFELEDCNINDLLYYYFKKYFAKIYNNKNSGEYNFIVGDDLITMLSLKNNSSNEEYSFNGEIRLFDLINGVQKDKLDTIFSICCNDYANNNFMFINLNNHIYMLNPKMKWSDAEKTILNNQNCKGQFLYDNKKIEKSDKNTMLENIFGGCGIIHKLHIL